MKSRIRLNICMHDRQELESRPLFSTKEKNWLYADTDQCELILGKQLYRMDEFGCRENECYCRRTDQ